MPNKTEMTRHDWITMNANFGGGRKRERFFIYLYDITNEYEFKKLVLLFKYYFLYKTLSSIYRYSKFLIELVRGPIYHP